MLRVRRDRRGATLAVCLASLLTAGVAGAQGSTPRSHRRRGEFVLGVPGTLMASARDAARPRNLPRLALLAAETGVLIVADQRVYDETRRLGRAIDLPTSHPQVALRAGGVNLIYAPTTISSTLYYLGDGWTTMAVAGSFLASGKARHDARAVRTASEITEGLLSLGVVTQTIKHIAGRQTPGTATVPRGRWRPLPRWKAYSANVPEYDAFPSGHIATAMSTVTIVALNYPEKRFVRPIGYSLMAALSLAMVNSGVHWVSDYPLGLAIGGIVGKTVARRGRDEPPNAEPRVAPFATPRGLGLRVTF